MENLIIFIIFIIFSVLRSLAENKQKAGQRPGGKPAGLPMPPVPRPPRTLLRPESIASEYPEVFLHAKETKLEGASGAWEPPVQLVPEPTRKHSATFKQDQLFQPQAATFLQGIVYAEVLGLSRAKKPWKYRK